MKSKSLILATLVLLTLVSPAFAGFNKKPNLRLEQLYRYDIRSNHHILYISRISSEFIYFDKEKKPLLKIGPFFEMRRNVNYDLWERYELGCEIGKDISPWFYLGESIQQVWLKEDQRNYTRNKRRDEIEAETRLMFSHNLLSGKNFKLKGFLLDEYTYDFRLGESTRNEIVLGFIMPIGKYLEADINWRHIDRIHDFDSDAVETSLTLVF